LRKCRIAGGDLLQRCIEVGPVPEIDAAHVLSQLLDAIGYLHKNGIAHRDLKPENVLVVSSDELSPDYWTVKLSDFGLSVQRESVMENVMSTLHGTPEFAAPEVLLLSKDKRQGMYSAKIDIWAIGCIAYVLLSSRTPFGSNGNVPAMMEKIVEGKYHFRGSTWRGVSKMAIRFDSSRIPSISPFFSARRRAIPLHAFSVSRLLHTCTRASALSIRRAA
jgi:serine/threonine protein kinase